MSARVYFQKGCIVSTTQSARGSLGGRALTWLIARISRMLREARTRSTHSALIVREGTLRSAMILEALWPRVVISPLAKYAGNMIVYRPGGLSREVCKLMSRQAIINARMAGGRRRGTIYGLLKLPLFLFDGLLSKILCYLWWTICAVTPGWKYRPFEVRLFTRINLLWAFVCSQIVARVYGEIAGIGFGHHWTRVTPDDIDDYCREHPEEFEQIYPPLK